MILHLVALLKFLQMVDIALTVLLIIEQQITRRHHALMIYKVVHNYRYFPLMATVTIVLSSHDLTAIKLDALMTVTLVQIPSFFQKLANA